MSSALNIALSGLNNARTRIAAGANNIVNARSTASVTEEVETVGPFMPLDVVNISNELGGVTSKVQSVDVGSEKVADSDHPHANSDGIVEYPNISIDEELGNQIQAVSDFKASALVIERVREMQGFAIDIFA